MSQQLINHNSDLHRLLDDGYEVSIQNGHLVVTNIPYLNSKCEICFGTLVSTLSLSGNKTIRPNPHTMMFAGEYPCDERGRPLEKIRNQSNLVRIGEAVTISHTFSCKPKCGYYSDYYEKVSTYATILCSPAAYINADVTPRTHRIIDAPDDSPFVYCDNASGRAGITSITQKLKQRSVAIIGLGGTGSYVLDLVSKTPVKEIHLFDGDIFEQHNAFRCPGAASIEQLSARLPKVEYLTSAYKHMHKGIVPHAEYISPENTNLLSNQSMVFICIDNNEAKVPIIEALEEYDIPFIDVGMGLQLVNSGLTGTLRTTTSVAQFRKHVRSRNRIPINSIQGNNVYDQNIQVADLNSMNACLAVIRWKKLCGFYVDMENEHFNLYSIEGNHILNEDTECDE
ncbi:MAG: ThiF family adenylyltransferase [Candidatus Thiodiazotropha taylori]